MIFGDPAVGRHAARMLADIGALVIGVSDSRGTIVDASGLDLDEFDRMKAAGGSVADSTRGESSDRDGVIDVEYDIWIPAARPDVLTATTVQRLSTRLVVQGANIPATAEAETWLHEQGILSDPDFIANAGGVICAAVEVQGGTAVRRRR